MNYLDVLELLSLKQEHVLHQLFQKISAANHPYEHRNTLNSTITDLLEVRANLEKMIASLREKSFELEQRENKLNVMNLQMKENAKTTIALNVGGQRFLTSKSTLLKVKDTYFDSMLSLDPNEDGEFFIDRDPKVFSTILNYLRTGRLHIEGLNQGDINALKQDLEFYLPGLEVLSSNLSPLKDVIPPDDALVGSPPVVSVEAPVATSVEPPPVLHWLEEYCASNLIISDQVISKKKGEAWGIALGSIPNLPSFKVKIIKTPLQLVVGLSPKQDFDAECRCVPVSCHCLHFPTGNLYSRAGKHKRPYTEAQIKEGSIIEIIYDKSNRTIRFTIDGESHPIAFTDVVEDDLYPLVGLCDSQTFVQLLASEELKKI